MSSPSSYKEFARLYIPLEQIASATNNFSDENLIRRGGFGKTYKGQLWRFGKMIDIVARRLDPEYKQGKKEFLMEVSMLSTLEHDNLVSIIGFCDEKSEKIIINKRETHGSLDKYLSDPTLTWMQRLEICVGVARALSYIHYDKRRDFSVIHRNIKSSKILLNDYWKPKLSGFELSMKNTTARRHRLLVDRLSGTVGYIDPKYEKTGGVTHKSDVYSFGVVLFEVMCGRRAFTNPEWFSTQLAKQDLEEKSPVVVGKLDKVVDQEPPSPESVDVNITGVIIQQKGPSSSSNNLSAQKRPLSSINLSIPMGKPSTRNLLIQTSVPSSRNFSLASRMTSSGSLAEGIPLRNFSGQMRPSSTRNLSGRMRLSSARNLSGRMHSLPSSRNFSVASRSTSAGSLADEIPLNNFSERFRQSSSRNFSVASRTTSAGSLADEIPFPDEIRPLSSKNFMVQIRAPSSRNSSLASRLTTSFRSLSDGITSRIISESMQPTSSSNLITEPVASLVAIGGEQETNIFSEQRTELNPGDMCMFTLAPSARFHYEQRLGHLCIPEEELLAPLAISHYEKQKLYDLIDPDLWKQMDPQSFDIFSKTAYCCLKEQRSERPHIDQIVNTLQEALDIQRKLINPLMLNEDSEVAEGEGTSTNHLKWKNMEHLKIAFQDIESATHTFSQKYRIGSGGYGMVYKAELEHYDIKNSLEIEGKNRCDLPKIRSTVAIKRLFKRKDTQAEVGFSAEIESLTSCNHPNIVSLLGFCDEVGTDLILVYEYVCNGSLDDYLRSSENMTNLKWEQRLQMCLDIAQGLNYLHNEQNIIHRDIKSDNILLDDKWVPKIADFGLSKIIPILSQKASYLETNVAGTIVYLDPEYEKTRKLKKASDIYSFGVVLFEIMSGRLAYNQAYMKENDKGLAPFARQFFNNGTLKDMLDPMLNEEFDENIFTLSKGPNKDSLDTFLDIAYQCLAETQALRPKIGTVVEKLKNALQLQKNHKDQLQIPLEDIKLATDTFSDNNRIGRGGFGRVYKGQVTSANGRVTTIAAKRLDTAGGQGETEFLTELEILLEYKHKNVIGLVGYCNEPGEKIIVYEYASKGSLDRHLTNTELTWRKRLEICIDIASGLDFLHGGGRTQEVVMHRDIKSPNILLGDDWKAKISDFGLSSITSINEDVIDNACGTKGYCDPLYLKRRIFTKKSDIYSFGVLLFEILCGRLMFEDIAGHIKILIDTFKRYYRQGKLDEMVFKGLKEQIAPKSLSTFQTLANDCVHDLREKRPTTGDVLLRLKQALEFQEDSEIWEPKLPHDYEEIFKMSSFSDIYSTKMKKDLHNLLFTGILLQKDKVLFSLSHNGERNEMISAGKFLYKHRRFYKWPSVPESRFQKVAKMSDISNLKIQANIKAQFLSVGVNYGVHLVFRFCGPRKSLAKRMYVNLKYKKGSETLHAYFATWREDGWMMIELCHFLNHKKDTSIKFLLESFSRCYCGSRRVYIEGIEFRAIDNVQNGEIKKSKEVQQVLMSDLNIKQRLPTYCEKEVKGFEYNDDGEKILSLNEVKIKKCFTLSAKEAIHESSEVKLLNSKPLAQSRFPDIIELQSQVFRIKCKIESQRLSPDTEYACHLVFKLSEKCGGLHCPVIVRDLLHRKTKETRILYFRSPSPRNADDADQVPVEREDGWTEVNVWQFNSNYDLRNDCISISLKLITYEGNMSGLIVSGLEFRPM